MLFNSSIHQSKSNQSVVAQPLFGRLQMRSVRSCQVDRLASCRRNTMQRVLDADRSGRERIFTGTKTNASCFQRDSASYFVLSGQQLALDVVDYRELYGEIRETIESRIHFGYLAVGEESNNSVAILAETKISCLKSANTNWHPVPFIYNQNRLTCRWRQPSM